MDAFRVKLFRLGVFKWKGMGMDIESQWLRELCYKGRWILPAVVGR